MCKDKMLIVDDDKDTLFMLSALMRNKTKGEVHEASSGELALEIIDPSFDIIITDMHMGEGRMNGNDVAFFARKVKKDLKIILLFSPYKIDPIPQLFNRILEKPVDANLLYSVL